VSDPRFLTVEEVVTLHARQLARFGGGDGLRDLGLLESAVAQPQASFGGTYVHEDVVAMAGAYLFHLVGNHAFVDGNKRIGLLAALVFLRWNGFVVPSGDPRLYDLTMGVAEGRLDKAAATAELRRIVASQPPGR